MPFAEGGEIGCGREVVLVGYLGKGTSRHANFAIQVFRLFLFNPFGGWHSKCLFEVPVECRKRLMRQDGKLLHVFHLLIMSYYKIAEIQVRIQQRIEEPRQILLRIIATQKPKQFVALPLVEMQTTQAIVQIADRQAKEFVEPFAYRERSKRIRRLAHHKSAQVLQRKAIAKLHLFAKKATKDKRTLRRTPFYVRPFRQQEKLAPSSKLDYPLKFAIFIVYPAKRVL